MDTPSITARTDVTFATSEPRQTPTPPRGAAFRDVLARTAVRGAEGAMRQLPGAPLMAVALRGGAGGTTSLGVPLTGTGTVRSAEGPGALGSTTGAASGSPTLGSLGNGAANAATGGGAVGDGSIESSLAESQDKNLYFLKLQSDMNAQNQYFTTVSNILKAEHETVKTAIGNIR